MASGDYGASLGIRDVQQNSLKLRRTPKIRHLRAQSSIIASFQKTEALEEILLQFLEIVKQVFNAAFGRHVMRLHLIPIFGQLLAHAPLRKSRRNKHFHVIVRTEDHGIHAPQRTTHL